MLKRRILRARNGLIPHILRKSSLAMENPPLNSMMFAFSSMMLPLKSPFIGDFPWFSHMFLDFPVEFPMDFHVDDTAMVFCWTLHKKSPAMLVGVRTLQSGHASQPTWPNQGVGPPQIWLYPCLLSGSGPLGIVAELNIWLLNSQYSTYSIPIYILEIYKM